MPSDAVRLGIGPYKIVLADSELPSLTGLTHRIHAVHATGRAIAAHCVTREALVILLAALDDAGALPGDRIEHGAVIPVELVTRIVALGVTVVTNPGFVVERGDAYMRDVEAHDLPHLYRCRSLLAAGIPVAAGTDAPFGSADPWTAVVAACRRRTRQGLVIGTQEGVTLPVAVSLFTGHGDEPARPRHVAVGEPGDLCLLAGGTLPLPGGSDVLATVVAGRVVHRTN